MAQIQRSWLGVSVAVFFFWGLSTVLIDSLVPKLKELFALGYAEVLLTQFSFFLGYLVFSLPAGHLLARWGYSRSIALGLGLAVMGCLLLIPATLFGRFPWFLGALFVLSAGITQLQVAVNPLVLALGPSDHAHSRLTLAQAFNSLGTTVGPLIGAAVILRQVTASNLAPLRWPFLAIASCFVVLGWLFWSGRDAPGLPAVSEKPAKVDWLLFRQRQFAFGWASIFVYVGAEVTLGSLMTNYLMQPTVLDCTATFAGSLVSLYWGGAMVGRFAGSWVLVRVAAARVLLLCAAVAMMLVGISGFGTGWLAAVTLLLVGLCNSIMFPVIYSLALKDMGDDVPQASGLLCLAIVGGALVPLGSGLLADQGGVNRAFILPLMCYGIIASFAYWTGSRKR